MEDSADNSDSPVVVLEQPDEKVQDQADWFSRLARKMAFVRRAADETGTNMNAAEKEVGRQIKQVSSGEMITKSGGEE